MSEYEFEIALGIKRYATRGPGGAGISDFSDVTSSSELPQYHQEGKSPSLLHR